MKKSVRPPWEEIFHSFGDGLIILDREMRITGINPAAEGIIAASAESVLGHLLKEAFPENESIFQRLEAGRHEMSAISLREVTWTRSRGKSATVDLSVTPLIDEQGGLSGWILVLRDVTPIKKLEEDIRKSDRLAMMGTIAAGLAHEIKNPLGGIKGAAQLLNREKLESEGQECVGIIIREVERVDRLVGQLLTFTRPKNLTLEPLNINELMDSLLLLQKKDFEEKKVEVVREYDPSLPPILGNADQLRQVFLNFLKNAGDAVFEKHRGKGGVVRLRSRMVTSFKIKGQQGKRPSRMILMEIEDNGIGIPREDFDKIFTPFFTKKEKGYGLGLAISQRMVEEHGGVIHVASEQGKGTSFQILLRSAL